MSDDGQRLTCRVPLSGIFRSPKPGAKFTSQLIFGEDVAILSDGGAYYQVESKSGVVGYVEHDHLGQVDTPSHIVCVPRAYVYVSPNSLAKAVDILSLGSRVLTDEQRGDFAHIDGVGWIYQAHLCTMNDRFRSDPVSYAELLLNTPYLFGGRSAFGIDCSGFIELCFAILDIAFPRDRGSQFEASLPIEKTRAEPKRGDLVFFSHHVGLMCDKATIIHCGSPDRRVTIQRLDWAMKRYVKERGRSFLGFRSVPK
ncbi:C40 family peptidase (plasmid) [Phaeobacter sp. BS23]|uniref:C40 family peptidase n=1 Tax=Phaeobacter sp. BS23 TaxID=2907239 RepID=UPI00370488D0